MKEEISYLLSLDNDDRTSVLQKMQDQQNGIQPNNVPARCTGPGSTPNGHWDVDINGKCIWVPEIG